MTICRKCGKEIPDGEELCEECKLDESNSGETYLDELIQNMENEEDTVPAASTEDETAEAEPDEDINELLKLLSQDYDEEDEDAGPVYDEDTPTEEIETDNVPVSNETSLFSEDEAGGVFADGSDAVAVDDVFQDALSAVDYSENEQESSEEEKEMDESDESLMALDPFALSEEEIPELEEETEPEADVQSVPVAEPVKKEKKKKEKKKKAHEAGFWKRTFGNIITEQTAEEEAKERELEKASEEERAQAKAEQKKKEDEEKEEKSEQVKAEKERKAKEKADQAAAKAAEKEEKKRLKAEAMANEVVGRINPVGATIVMIFFGLICVAVIFGTQIFSYTGAVKTANNEFNAGDYRAAYEAVAGVDVSESEKENTDKIRICMQLQKELDSYSNYYKMKMYLEALDSLMKGIRSYDTNKGKADQYGILSQYNALESKLASTLYSEFGVSETQARTINSAENQLNYTTQLEDIVSRWTAKNQQDEK